MSAFINLFSAIDTFSVRFNPSLNLHEIKSSYKSPLGGIISLLIYAFGISYSVILFSQWYNSKMVMKVSSQQESYQQDTYQNIFNNSGIQNLFQIRVYSQSLEQMDDPFQENAVIVLPMMINMTSRNLTSLLSFHDSENNQLEFTLEDSIQYNLFYLFFLPCIGNEQLLDTGKICASQEKSDAFFALPGLEIDMNYHFNVLNLYTKEITQVSSFTVLHLQKTLRQDLYWILEYSYYEIISGFLFQTIDSIMLQTDYHVDNHYLEQGYLEQSLSGYINADVTLTNVLGSIYLTTDMNVNHVVAEYPTISEVLASIGSTVQTLLLVRYFIMMFNEYKMLSDFKLFCRKLYYPEIEQIKVSGRGKKSKVFLGDKQMDLQSYRKFIQNIDVKIKEKMSYTNLLYEISRMQIVLQDISSLQINQFSHLKRSGLNYEYDLNTKLYILKSDQRQTINQQEQISIDPLLDPFFYNYSSIKNLKSVEITIPIKQQEIPSHQILFSNDEVQYVYQTQRKIS